MLNKLKCWLGFHDWINLNKEPYPNLGPGEFMLRSDLHECSRCKKRALKGMGWIL